MHAIYLWAQECVGVEVYILSDSQAELTALATIAWDTKESLQLVASNNNKITLMWLHGYESIEGNEIADKSAKQGATASFYGPGLIVGLENRYRIAEVRKWEKTQLEIDWSKILDKQKGFLRFLDLSKDKAYHKPLPIKAS